MKFMNVLEQIEEHMQAGLTEEQASQLVDIEYNIEDYFNDGFDDERERLIKSIEEELM